MSRPISLRDESGERQLHPDEFPISLGGPGSDAEVRLPGVGSPERLAFLGLSDGELFVQPALRGIPIFRNERLLETSAWLRDGDTIRIETARLTCELSPERIGLRVSVDSASRSDEPLVILPPPVPPQEIAQVAYKPAAPTRTGGLPFRPLHGVFFGFFLPSY